MHARMELYGSADVDSTTNTVRIAFHCQVNFKTIKSLNFQSLEFVNHNDMYCRETLKLFPCVSGAACDDNIQYGILFARQYLDTRLPAKRSREEVIRRAVNVHNNNAGRQVRRPSKSDCLQPIWG